MEYGDAVLAGCRAAVARQRQIQPTSTEQEVATSLFSHVTKLDKSGTYYSNVLTAVVPQQASLSLLKGSGGGM